MTQQQLYQLAVDAEELIIYDDITEVYIFLHYLSEKYQLVYNYSEARRLYLTNTVYLPPKE